MLVSDNDIARIHFRFCDYTRLVPYSPNVTQIHTPETFLYWRTAVSDSLTLDKSNKFRDVIVKHFVKSWWPWQIEKATIIPPTIPWSLAGEWAPIARQVLENNYAPTESNGSSNNRVRFRDVWSTLKQWSKGRVTGAVRKLPTPVQNKVIAYIAAREERKARKSLTKRR